MRHPWAAQQRVWLGPDRHRQRCWDAVTNSEPESYAHSNSDAVCMRTDAIAYTYGIPNGNRHSYCNGHCHRDGYGELYAQTDTYTEISAVSEASPDPGAETIEIFAIAKIRAGGAVASREGGLLVIRDRCCFGRLARSDGVYRETRTRAHFLGRQPPVCRFSQNSVDTFLRIQVEGRSTVGNQGN